MHPVELAEVMAAIAREIDAPRGQQEALDTIVAVAGRQLDHLVHVGVSILHSDGSMETVAATDDLVRTMDEVQYRLAEGPCVQSMKVAEVTVAERLRHDQRWPRFVPEAVRHGVLSQLAVRLWVHRTTLGGLNLYSTTSETIDHDTVRIAQLFATHAALALGHRRVEDQLSEALESRRSIGVAVGIVMERHDLDEARAFDYLTRVSSQSNLKLREVANRVIASVRLRAAGLSPEGVDQDQPRR